MKKIERLYSKDKSAFIDVVQNEYGSYVLQRFSIKFDPEEGKYYEVRVFPDPGGKYGEASVAVMEAERMLE